MFGMAIVLALGNLAYEVERSGDSRTIRVTVGLVLVTEASGVEITQNLGTLPNQVTSISQLHVGEQVYLEVWCQTNEPTGIAVAVVDMTYPTTFFDTTVSQITIAPHWMDMVPRSVDDADGFINDIGGLSLYGLGTQPDWAKLGTVEFDIGVAPDSAITFCTQFAGPGRQFGIRGVGAVLEEEVNYGCLDIGIGLGDCNNDGHIDLLDFAAFNACATGPLDPVYPFGCGCFDANDDGDVDMSDFMDFQILFSPF